MRADSLALKTLAELLNAQGYEFVTVTPETHARVNKRALGQARLLASSLRDVFGWNRPFDPKLLPAPMLECLVAADALEEGPGGLRSRVRYSTLNHQLYVHSAYPTLDPAAVFFGPDTYRFAALLARWAPHAERAVDIGCGTGAGLLSIAGRVQHLVLADLNPRALQYAEVNASLSGQACELIESDILAAVGGNVDLVISNPPYLHDDAERVYRHGGGAYGTALSVRIVQDSLARLQPNGTLIVYTGTPILDGVDLFYESVRPHLPARSASVVYETLDPDVFGEELSTPAYSEVERIAVVGLKVSLSGNL